MLLKTRVLIAAEGDGVVEYVDAEEIVIRYKELKMKDLLVLMMI
jgi:hypothetical protein